MMEAWHIWVIAGLMLWIIEIFTPGFFVMGVFGTACLVVALVAGAGVSFKLQLLVFGVAVGIMALAIRPFVMKNFYRRNANTKTNVDALVGKSGFVTEDIDHMTGTGRVKIGGEVWRAVTPDDARLTIGQKVTVRELEGCKVIVEAATENKRRRA